MAIGWSEWQTLERPAGIEVGRPFAQSNQDGRLQVFVIGSGGIFDIRQLAPNGGWSRWESQGKPPSGVGVQAHVVGRNADGRQEIFAIGEDRAIWQKWQVAPNQGFSEWKRLGAPRNVSLEGRMTVGQNQDGRQELFAAGADGNIWQVWQTSPNGGWSEWKQLGRPPAGLRGSDRISIAINDDRRQELFAMGGDDALWHIAQVAPNVGWGAWKSLGKPRDVFDGSEPPKDRDLHDPVVARNADGHLEVFSPGNGAFCNRWQERWREGADRVTWRHQGWNAKPKPAPTAGLTRIEAARNLENRLETVALADDGAVWHAWQVDQAPFWSAWKSLGRPAVGLREADPLTLGINQDGRLEAFAVGRDGNLWHIWQVR